MNGPANSTLRELCLNPGRRRACVGGRCERLAPRSPGTFAPRLEQFIAGDDHAMRLESACARYENAIIRGGDAAGPDRHVRQLFGPICGPSYRGAYGR